MADPISRLIETYHELNAALVDELDEEPSPMEFSRYVAKNRPFVVRGVALDWKAVQCWDAHYLCEVMDGEEVKVAVTPLGNADAVVERWNGTLCMAEPYEAFEPFSDFLDDVQQDSASSSIPTPSSKNVKYAQTQNDNLRSEYIKLFEDVHEDIRFASIALDQKPDAINIWIGNERSVTALHKDNYENVYIQIRGQKHFVLLASVEMPCVNEQPLPRTRYVPALDSISTSIVDLGIPNNKDSEPVPVPTWDPDEPGKRTTTYSHLAKPLRVTLEEGDMLYLPAMWYHKVSQTSGAEGFACAVNYWYDMDFSGPFWAHNSFLRDVLDAERRRHDGRTTESNGVST